VVAEVTMWIAFTEPSDAVFPPCPVKGASARHVPRGQGRQISFTGFISAGGRWKYSVVFRFCSMSDQIL